MWYSDFLSFATSASRRAAACVSSVTAGSKLDVSARTAALNRLPRTSHKKVLSSMSQLAKFEVGGEYMRARINSVVLVERRSRLAAGHIYSSMSSMRRTTPHTRTYGVRI